MPHSCPVFYAYCFTFSDHPVVREMMGLEKSPLILVEHGAIAMVVHEVVNEQAIRSVVSSLSQGLTAEKISQMPINLLDHEKVVEALAGHRAVTPIRALTLLRKPEVESLLAKFADEIAGELKLFTGVVEMGLKIVIPFKLTDPLPPTGSPGQDYIQKKMAAYQSGQIWEQTLATVRQQIEQLMQEKLVRVIQKPVKKGENWQFEFLYLIDKASVPLFKSSIKAQMQNIPQARYLLSGPWAPYHFTKLKLA